MMSSIAGPRCIYANANIKQVMIFQGDQRETISAQFLYPSFTYMHVV